MENIFVIIIIVIIILLLCFVAMAVKIWVKKNGKFAETEIERNKHMQKLGIKCTKQEELEHLNKTQNPNCNACESCVLKEIKD